MPILKKPNAPQGNKNPQQAQQRPSKSAGDPFAKKYAETEAATRSGFIHLQPGIYNMLIVAGVYEVDEQKTYAYIECQVVDPDVEDSGKNCRIYWNFTDENGQEASGWKYFKSNMTMLGHDTDFESLDEAKAFLAQLAEDQTWVIVDVKKSKGYTNYYLNSVPENQSEKPELINPY